MKELNEAEEKITSVREIIESVCEDICDNYCKWGDLIRGINMSDTELDEFYEAHCNNCALNKLH